MKEIKEDPSDFLYKMNYNPPIPKRDTEELILMAHSSPDYVQPGAIYQAKEELKKRGVSEEYKEQVISLALAKQKKLNQQLEREHQIELVQNAEKKYSTLKMVQIFFLAPLIIFHKMYFSSDLSYSELKKENFVIMAQQRIQMLFLGAICWGIIILLLIHIN
ncbi:MAG: hypothetical protein WCK09_13385 [Bacteroidota bacterium]